VVYASHYVAGALTSSHPSFSNCSQDERTHAGREGAVSKSATCSFQMFLWRPDPSRLPHAPSFAQNPIPEQGIPTITYLTPTTLSANLTPLPPPPPLLLPYCCCLLRLSAWVLRLPLTLSPLPMAKMADFRLFQDPRPQCGSALLSLTLGKGDIEVGRR
jgi:hypothetical protein